MDNTIIITLMRNLIEKNFYKTKDEAVQKLDIYFALNRISQEEYTNLCVLAEETYTDIK